MEAVDRVERVVGEVVDETASFFAPVSTDLLDALLGEYQLRRGQIDQLAALVGGELGNVVHYFIEGNAGDDKFHRTLYLDRLFEVKGAVHQLDSAYWGKALALTDVYKCMPQERKNAWNKQLKEPAGVPARHTGYDRRYAGEEGRTLLEWEVEPLPAFEEATVRATITTLLHERSKFMAEKVDGIFRALSGEHVTNRPEGFGKRMILAHVLNSYGHWAYERIGYLNDLRCVIARFMGRDEPLNQGPTNDLLDTAKKRRGKWVVTDGGALKVRAYKCGTAHVEVHPDMAYRLNQVLAQLHPLAIPPEFRERPKRAAKKHEVLGRPLPFAVLEVLRYSVWPGDGIAERRFVFGHGAQERAAYKEACGVLRALGGVEVVEKSACWLFDFPFREALREVLTSGCMPDQKTHQFYPTPEKLARICAELADVGEFHTVLEPSAGQGDLAEFLPMDRTTCVEVSKLHCAVLRGRGLDTINADFLEWAASPAAHGARFDRVVMNPPFSNDRWSSHVEAAAQLVRAGGRIVAILPASARGKDILGAAWDSTWSEVYRDEFPGTSVAVVILTGVRHG